MATMDNTIIGTMEKAYSPRNGPQPLLSRQPVTRSKPVESADTWIKGSVKHGPWKLTRNGRGYKRPVYIVQDRTGKKMTEYQWTDDPLSYMRKWPQAASEMTADAIEQYEFNRKDQSTKLPPLR